MKAPKFPCKHEIYELAELVVHEEPITRLQLYAPEEFVWASDPECFYCSQEPKLKVTSAQEH